jgi:hypothetical protein
LLLQVLQQFYADPDWVAAMLTQLPHTVEELESRKDNGTLFGGAMFRYLAGKRPIVLLQLDELWELCLDWLNPFNTLTYSVGVIGIRCVALREFDVLASAARSVSTVITCMRLTVLIVVCQLPPCHLVCPHPCLCICCVMYNPVGAAVVMTLC